MSTKTKFTKGGWVAHISLDECFISSGGDCIADLSTSCIDDRTQDANAHLIAAAPKMYEMIEELSAELLHMIRKENSRLLQNINPTNLDEPDYLDEETVYLAQQLLSQARGE